MSRFLVFLLLLTPFGAFGVEPSFQSISSGLEYAEVDFSTSGKVTPLAVLRADLTLLTPIVLQSQPPRTVRSAVEEFGATSGINGSFFDPSDRPLGLLVQNGEKLRPIHRGGNLLTALFLSGDFGVLVTSREDSRAQGPLLNAFQAGPLLIDRGQKLPLRERGDFTRRSALAMTREKKLLLVATKNRIPGITLQELQDFLSLPALRVTSAMNLDGGGSSQLFAKDVVQISGGDSVPVILLLKGREKN